MTQEEAKNNILEYEYNDNSKFKFKLMSTDDELKYFSSLSEVKDIELQYSSAEGILYEEPCKIYMPTTKQRIAINVKPGILEIEE